jgi:GNAT superfamily N-acetyltransferase
LKVSTLQVSVRKADKKDTYEIAKIHVHSWQEHYKNILPESFLSNLSIEAKKSHWEKIIDYNKSKVNELYVAECNNQIIGFLAVGLNANSEKNNSGEIFAIYVEQSYQKKGTGKLLYKEALDLLSQSNVDELIVWSLEDNNTAHFAYESWGGVKTLEKKHFDIDNQIFTEIQHRWNLTDL